MILYMIMIKTHHITTLQMPISLIDLKRNKHPHMHGCSVMHGSGGAASPLCGLIDLLATNLIFIQIFTYLQEARQRWLGGNI